MPSKAGRKALPDDLKRDGRIRVGYTKKEREEIISISEKLRFSVPGDYLIACEKLARKMMLKNHVQENGTRTN